jgi:hypothetical protein
VGVNLRFRSSSRGGTNWFPEWVHCLLTCGTLSFPRGMSRPHQRCCPEIFSGHPMPCSELLSVTSSHTVIERSANPSSRGQAKRCSEDYTGVKLAFSAIQRLPRPLDWTSVASIVILITYPGSVRHRGFQKHLPCCTPEELLLAPLAG